MFFRNFFIFFLYICCIVGISLCLQDQNDLYSKILNDNNKHLGSNSIHNRNLLSINNDELDQTENLVFTTLNIDSKTKSGDFQHLSQNHPSTYNQEQNIETELRPLVLPDSTNTYMRLNQTTLDFLSSLPAPLYIMTITGRAKTGKSFLMNKILQKKAFDIGLSFKPGTKGVWIWGPETIMRRKIDPKSNVATFEKLSVLYLDTEGLGAPGNPADSYDPKLCAISLLISSLIMYNVKSEIQVDDVNLLHSVVTLSSIFEKTLPGEKFPFPPMIWTVQQFQHELEGESPESYLDWVLKEKSNVLNRRDIELYNETVRVVNQFPTFESRILLMDHPSQGNSLPEISQLLWKQLGTKYRQQVNFLRRFVHEKIEPKSFNGILVSGKVIVEILKELIPELNSIDAPNVGPALVRQLSFALRDQLFERYQSEMESQLSLPSNIDIMDDTHLKLKKSLLKEFQSKCTGSMQAHDNIRAYEDLKTKMDTSYEDLLNRNTLLTNIASNQLIQEIFKDVTDKKYSSVDEFEIEIEKRFQIYLDSAKGDRLLIEKTLEEYKSKSIQLKRSLVLHDNSNKDLGQMLALLTLAFLFSYFSSLILSIAKSDVLSQFFTSLCTISVFLAFFILGTFHRFFDIVNLQIIEFEQLQYWFLGMKKLLTLYGIFKPMWNLLITLSSPLAPYHIMSLILIFALILAWKLFSLCRKHQRSSAVVNRTNFVDIFLKGKVKKSKDSKRKATNKKRIMTHYSDSENEYNSDQENEDNPFQIRVPQSSSTFVSNSLHIGSNSRYASRKRRENCDEFDRRYQDKKYNYSDDYDYRRDYEPRRRNNNHSPLQNKKLNRFM